MLRVRVGLGCTSVLHAQLAPEMLHGSFLNNWTVLMQHVSTICHKISGALWNKIAQYHDVNCCSKVDCDVNSRFGYCSWQVFFFPFSWCVSLILIWTYCAIEDPCCVNLIYLYRDFTLLLEVLICFQWTSTPHVPSAHLSSSVVELDRSLSVLFFGKLGVRNV
jgi:hypothetical protein